MPPKVVANPELLRAGLADEWADRARNRLATFVRCAWPHVETGVYVGGKHLETICDRLEAVNRGDARRLLINLPPRHSKSLVAAVFWPAWTWLQDEHNWPLAGSWVQFLFASHSHDLAVRDSRRCRTLIQSAWYQGLAKGKVELRDDGGTAMHAWELTSGGARRSTSIEARITGFGADIHCVDDPSDVREVESAAARESVRVFFQESLPSRINNPSNNARIVTAQRTHVRDLSALILESSEPYEHLCLPGRYDPEHPHRCALDWRTEPGQLLWPERFVDPAAYDDLAGTSYARAAQVQQNPEARGAGIFRNAKWQFSDDYPRNARLGRYWDKAATAEALGGDPDYTAGALGGFDEHGMFWLVDMIRGRWSSHQVEQRISLTAREIDGPRVSIWLEEEPGSSGKDVSAHYQRLLRGYAVRGDRATGHKLVRIDPFLAACEAGNVVLVRKRYVGNGQGVGPEPATWHGAFLAECDAFTGDDAGHDDQVVAASQLFGRMANVRGEFSMGRLLGV